MSLLLMLLIAGSVLMINTVLSNKQVLQHELNALTEVTSLTITPALIFDNSADAQQTLTSLKAHKNIIYAAVTKTGQQQPFAVFSRHSNEIIPEKFITNCGPISFSLEFMQVCKPLTFDRTEYGHIILIISLNDIYNRLLKELAIALLGLAFAALVIFWYLEKIAKRLSDPILELVSISEDIKHSSNYQQRATITSTDEIGQLGLAFNDMLEQIHNRNQALNQQKDTLEDQVQARTQDLQHKTDEAYQLANKAQAASKAKSEFLATMSHEIRTPMNGILGMTELLLNTPLNNRQKRLADTAYRSAESLLSIINNILDFSKIESGKFQLSLADFDLRHLLEDTTEIIASQAHTKGLELALNLPPELDSAVHGDADRLRQVFVNLLGNAIKFTQHGEIQLKVSLIESNNSKTHLNLLCEVKDTGPGIAPEQQGLIFESFTQADGSITRHHGGTGLGLTISRQLLELMGSELKLTSTLGEGSCFSFSLCLKLSKQSIPQKADLSSLHDINVLIVDDNASYREILSSQLNHWGINCHSASSAAQAINYLRDANRHNITYKIALLDCHMPEIDGLALAKTLHEDPLLQSLSLVMLSSDCSPIDHDKSREYGIKYFLTKPVTQKKLLACLLEITGSSSVPASRPDLSKNNLPLSGNVLLAEDNLVNQEVGVAILRSIGCETDIANNGAEAVTAASNKQYDIILMDCHMPIMDGFEASTKIREAEKSNNKEKYVPIIALTADVKKGIVEQCKKAGMDEYISKPFTQKQLQTILGKYLTAKPALSSDTQIEQTTKVTAPAEIIDRAALENLRPHITENGESLLTKAINIFSDSAPKQLKALQKAFEQQEYAKIERVAHSLKSACANLGAMSLTKFAAIIEDSAEQKNIQGIAALLTKIQNDLPIVISTLNNELKGIEVAQNSNQPTHQAQPSSSQNKSILIVDDDKSFRLITRSVLTAAGFLVDEANNGKLALEKIKQHKPDLILLDALMEHMDGFEACALIRQKAEMVDVPIIMVTGLADIESIHHAFDSGATDFILKPINYAILTHRLNFILRAGQDAAELRISQLHLSAAQRIARLGYWVWDVKQNHFQISEQLADLCKINLQHFEGTLEGFIALIHPEDQLMVQGMILAPPSSSAIEQIEYRLQATQSKTIFVHQEIIKVIENGHFTMTGTVQDISQRKANEKQIHTLAYFDILTGLPSRSFYQERIQTLIKSAKQHNHQFSFLYIDLDGFKDINDSLGHNQGDQLLKEIAHRLQEMVRDNDFVARLGGDEFCILLNNTDDRELITQVADRCLENINKPLFLNHQQIRPRASIGIATFPLDGDNEVDLMKAADTAMYAAKQTGKQRYTFYSQDMAEQAKSHLEKEHMLREAFEKDQFILHYQPQICMQTGRMVSMEALTRWQHPEKGMIPPNDFIPEIERLGLIVELGDWVIKTACEQIMLWHNSGLPYMQVAVNLSALHFQDTLLLDTIQDALNKTGVPAKYLELEVTESAMQATECLSNFKALRQLGIKISIDDFGTGYSCLASLKQLPLDCLKIDKIFIDDVTSNPDTALLLGAIIGLANALNYTLVAEGVETKDQALVMHGLGCNIIQGYLFSRPVSSDKIPALIDVDFTPQTKTDGPI